MCVWVWKWRWWEGVHSGNVCLAACLCLCIQVCALLSSSFVLGIIYNSRQFYNSPFGAIYIDRTGCQAQAQNTGFSWIALFLSLHLLSRQQLVFYIDTESLSKPLFSPWCHHVLLPKVKWWSQYSLRLWLAKIYDCVTLLPLMCVYAMWSLSSLSESQRYPYKYTQVMWLFWWILHYLNLSTIASDTKCWMNTAYLITWCHCVRSCPPAC